MKALLLTVTLVIYVSFAGAQPKGNLQAGPKKVMTQRFICDVGYSQKKCDQQMSILRNALAKYSVSLPDNWTWILVLSERWKPLMRERRMNPNTPAFTYLDKRRTFVEEAIVVREGAIGRRTELLKEWRMPLDQLLDLAVTHELGHAICHEADEGKADRHGQMLREGKPIVCDKQWHARDGSHCNEDRVVFTLRQPNLRSLIRLPEEPLPTGWECNTP